MHHFKQVHEREQEKRVRRLESARGPRRVRLAAAMSAKMHKYRTAARGLFGRPGVGVGDEIRRAGFVVRVVADKPEAVDSALRREVVGLVERRAVGCVVLVSDDLEFAGVVGMARERGVRTVVVGGDAGGGLRRCADSGFLWREVVSGKARKEAGVVVGRWKDRELLKRLEWTYRPERGKELGDDMDDTSSEMEEGVGQWWELDSDEDRSH